MLHRCLVSSFWCSLLTGIAPSAFSADDPIATVKLPYKYSQFTAAGGGKFLIFHFVDQNKAGIFDITTGKVEVQIDGVGAGDLLAGSAAKLIVVSPGKMMIRRWDLESGKRDGITLLKGCDPASPRFYAAVLRGIDT